MLERPATRASDRLCCNACCSWRLGMGGAGHGIHSGSEIIASSWDVEERKRKRERERVEDN